MMTEVQAQALATFVARIRPDWDHPGIMAALGKAANLGTPAQVARALVNLAENHDLRTPAILAQPGSHWSAPNGERIQIRGTNDVHCHEHPSSVHPCPHCAAKSTPPPVNDPEWIAMKRELEARRTPRAVQKRLSDFASKEQTK